VGVAWPRARMRSSTLRRDGSAMASHSSSSPGGTLRPAVSGLSCDIVLQAGQVGFPALVVRLIVAGRVLVRPPQGGEPAFGDAQPGSAALGGQSELHQQRVVLRRLLTVGVVPAERK